RERVSAWSSNIGLENNTPIRRPYLSPPATTLGVTCITPTTCGLGWFRVVESAVMFACCQEPSRYSSRIGRLFEVSGLKRTRYFPPWVIWIPLHDTWVYVSVVTGTTSERFAVPLCQPFNSRVQFSTPALDTTSIWPPLVTAPLMTSVWATRMELAWARSPARSSGVAPKPTCWP